MRVLATILVATVVLMESANAQRTATCTINNFQRSGGTYSFDIWGRRTNATQSIPVGTSQFFLNYNSSALSTPTLSNINVKYTGVAGVDDYDPMSVDIVGGKIAVTILYSGNIGDPGQPLSTTVPDGERICTVNLTVTNATAPASLTWDEINSAFTTTNSQPVAHTFIGSDEGALPITLSSFTATVLDQGRVKVDWTTISETNNYGFEVQKSQTNQSLYQTIPNSFVAGHGTTTEPQSYTFTDNTASVGRWFYRLRQIDLDGTEHFTEGIQVDVLTSVTERPLPTEFAMDQNYPNPFNPTTNIDFAVPRASQVTLEVYNLIGQRVATLVDEVKPAGYYSATFNASSFASGLYFYKLSAGQTSFLKKMMLVK